MKSLADRWEAIMIKLCKTTSKEEIYEVSIALKDIIKDLNKLRMENTKAYQPKDSSIENQKLYAAEKKVDTIIY